MKPNGVLEKLDGLSLEAFHRALHEARVPVAVAFSNEDAAGAPTLTALMEKGAREFDGQVRFMTCDPRTAPQIAESYQLEYLPDVLVFDGLDVTERLHGIESYDELKNIVENGARRAQHVRVRS